MKAYELRRADGVKRTFLLASDDAACRYAAGITERGMAVEIWLAGAMLATVMGTQAQLLPGAWAFDPSAAPDRTDQ